jgi:diadenosine tetraphosphate (Ap4A) HIT family hydrolase
MIDNTCGYCVGGEVLAQFGIKICDLNVSQLILFKEQSHPGRCVVAYKEHISEIVDLTPVERAAFLEDVARASNAIHKVFHPDKVNYGAFGDTGKHLHVHLVPKYRDGFEWGGTFVMNPQQKFLSDEEYAEMIGKIKAAL